MACRGCSSDGCSCSVTGDGVGITVTGSGTPITSPYVVALNVATALNAIPEDNITACDVLNDPHVPVLLGDGSVKMIPLPCPDSTPDALFGPIPGQAFGFTWSDTTGGSPADGRIAFNNAVYSLVTEINVSTQDSNAVSIADWLQSLNTISGSPKGMIKVYLRSNPTKWATFRVINVLPAVSNIVDITVVYVDHNGAMSAVIAGDAVMDFAPASEGSVGPVGGFNSVQVLEAVTGAYTLDIGDLGKYLRCANASPFTVTVPLNATVPFAIGTHIDFIQSGAGQITFAGTVGVTINAAPGLKLNGQWAGATLVKVATDTWDIVGNLTA